MKSQNCWKTVPDRIFCFSFVFLFPLTPPGGTRRTLPTQRPICPRTIFPFSLYATSWHRAEVPDILPNRCPTDFSFLHHLVVHFVSLFSFFFLHHLVAQSRSPRHTAQNGPRRTFVFFFFPFLTPPSGTFSFFFTPPRSTEQTFSTHC